MTTRQELLNQWQERLIEAEQACLAAESPAWSDRVRVKLYRFLLTMYGHTTWPGPKDDVDDSLGRAAVSQVTVAQPKAELAGKEPRTRAEILRGLRNVKGLGEELAPAGPLQGGLLPNSPMVVASYKRRPAAEIALDHLRRAGLQPTITRQGKLWQIYVTADEFDIALQCLRVRERPAPRVPTLTVVRPGIITLLSAIFFGSLACFMAGMLVQRLMHFAKSELPAPEAGQISEVSVAIAVVVLLWLLGFVLYRSWARGQRADRTRFLNEPAVSDPTMGRDPR